MQNFFTAEGAILILFELTLNVLAVFCRRIVLAFTFAALKSDDINSCLFLATHFISPKKDESSRAESDR